MGAFASNLGWALLIAAPVLFAQPITIDSGSSTDQFFTCATPGSCDKYSITLIPVSGDLTLRYGSFTYKIPEAPGLYKLSLFMRETGTVTAANQRKFTVKVNGQSPASLTNLDLFAISNTAELQRDLIVVSDGKIVLDFITVLRSAVVSRIVLTPLPTLSIVTGFGLQERLDSADAINRTFEVNTSEIMHRVAVPVSGSPCNIRGEMAVDANAQYYCIQDLPVIPNAAPWGHWVTFPRLTGLALLRQISETILLSSVSETQTSLGYTLSNTPVPDSTMVFFLRSIFVGRDYVTALKVASSNPKELEIKLPEYRPLSGDTILVLYWTIEP